MCLFVAGCGPLFIFTGLVAGKFGRRNERGRFVLRALFRLLHIDICALHGRMFVVVLPRMWLTFKIALVVGCELVACIYLLTLQRVSVE